MRKVVVATNNGNKVKEFKEIFKPLNIEIVSLRDLNIDIDVEETGATFQENAILKAKGIYEVAKVPVISEDSGLCIDVLDGRPGVYSKRYYDGKTEYEGNLMILEELKGIPKENRTARYVAALCYYDGHNLITTEGLCEGIIADRTIGTNGFAYDPIFIATCYGKTFGELSEVEKNCISHRKRGIDVLLEKIKNL